VARAVEKSPWVPQVPTIKQLEFLASPAREKLYGGAAGGGKSSAILMDASLGVDFPGYSAVIFRRSYADLALPNAIMDRSKQWWMGTAAKWNDNDKEWTFPSGAKVTFAYLKHENDKFRYQGAEFQYIAFDELTQFTRAQYSYLRSRLRRVRGMPVALRMGNTSNPGGVGHEWVYEEFVKGTDPARVFIPAALDDNPHLNRAEYVENLQDLDDITREQLLKGVWVQDETGHPFRREYWRGKNRYLIEDDALSEQVIARWISVDTALKDTEGSAYNVAVVLELLSDYRVRVRYVWREKLVFPELVAEIERLASAWDFDGLLRGVIIEDKASGTSAYQTIASGADRWLADRLLLFNPGQAPKLSRWSQTAVWCKRDCVLLPHPGTEAGAWLEPLQAELFAVPDAEYKDQADALSQGVIFLEHYLAEGYRARLARNSAAA
jgi:phage terminase large subunit-like protein